MRNLNTFLLFALSFCFIIASCSKRNSDPLNPTGVSEDFKYEISGLSDTSIERSGEVRFIINVNKVAGETERVNLTAIDLPDGMSVNFTSGNGEEAPYATSALITTTRTPVGDYNIKIRGAAPTAGIKDYPVAIKVLPYSNEAILLKGEFTESGACVQQGNVNHSVVITVVDTVKNRILLKGLSSGTQTTEVYADVDASAKTITIPSQLQSFVTFEGSGTYDDNSININYTVKGSAVNESCTTVLTRK